MQVHVVDVYIEYDKKIIVYFFFFFCFFISLFIYGFIFLRVVCRLVHLSEWRRPSPPPKKNKKKPKKNKQTIFIKMEETPSVCREHVHTGRLCTRIDYNIFKKSSLFNKIKIKT